MKQIFLIGVFLALMLMAVSFAQDEAIPEPDTIPPPTVAPPQEVIAKDTPNDAGSSITVKWKRSVDDLAGTSEFIGYNILRGTSPDGPFEKIDEVPVKVGNELEWMTYIDYKVIDGADYYYTIESKAGGALARTAATDSVVSSQQWFNTNLINMFILTVIVIGAILYYISHAKAGKKLYIRKIAGLEAVDEAVGRATEMGRKIFFIPGTQDMNEVQTIAGLTILSRVAKLTAEYEASIDVPVSRSLVMVTAREVVKEAYINAGRPETYSDDMVYYLTDDQFGYAAGIDGLIVRQKPATIFYQGAFYAESLILAETGNSIGAIQIAGTAMPSQLPFFVASCDYTLIGEELFAASAYLSHEPKQLGSLKGQDFGKMLIILSLIIGFVIQVLGICNFASLFNVTGG
ncbi:MAG: hypothetical protein J7K40_05165 [candidate division Zixibacteria bacterium]|nr:hypothetical protein [candidate division Zixibacteria bacterium]